jgi:pimeloyl-ACP methyl ester carboxylesterase
VEPTNDTPDHSPQPAESAPEACPPPLAWREVLSAFHEQADDWSVDRPGYHLPGRAIGTGSPLYLLGGFGGSYQLYALLAWLLRDDFRCVLWDYPGVLAGPQSAQRGTLNDLAADVSAVAAHFGETSIDVYAPSFGSLVALTAMLEYPPLVGKAVLQGGFSHRSLSRFERWLTRACRFYPGTLRNFPGSRAVREYNHRRWFPPFDETRWQFLEGLAGQVRISTLAWQATLIRDADLRPRLKEIDRPVLLIETEGEGAATRECQRELAHGLPRATEETLLGTGQYPYLTHPHRLAKIIRQFLSREEAARP